MRSRSGSRSTLVASALLAGALVAGRALADQAPPAAQPPQKPAEPVTVVTDRMVLVDKDGKRVEQGPAVIKGRRMVIIDHDDGSEGVGLSGVGDRREVFILRDGPGAGGGPGARMRPGPGIDGPRMGGRGMQGPGGRGVERMMRMARELGLTPEQRTQMHGLMQASRPKMEALRGQLRAERLKMREADPNAKGYDALVASTSKRIGELTAQRVQQQAQLQRQVWQLLTPEQRAKAETKKAEAKKRRAEQADRMERRARELRGTP